MKKKIKKIKLSRIVLLIFTFLLFAGGLTTFIVTYSEYVSRTQRVASGISGNIVYVNDMEADWYYYLGQNYTYSSDGRLPTTANKNLYNKDTLVEAKVTYSGTDLNTNNTGYVSLTELQHTYVYFKMYPINTNGTSTLSDDYITIELIDVPFTHRPTDSGFNGWYTNYLDAEISYENARYIRYAKVPVTYDSEGPVPIDITFNASWTAAKTYLAGSATWANIFTALDTKQMQTLETTTEIRLPLDMSGYFLRVSIARNASCSGMYNANGVLQGPSCSCGAWGGCTYYTIISNQDYVDGTTYYELRSGSMQTVNVNTLPFQYEKIWINGFGVGYNMSAFYRRVVLPNGTNFSGLYTVDGVETSGRCNTGAGCTYYELIQYYKTNGTQELIDPYETYYYLASRDTNIVVINTNRSNIWAAAQNKPFTMTGIHNGTDYNVTWTVSSQAPLAQNDMVIENLRISAGTGITGQVNPPTGATSRTFRGNAKNVKIGRGIKRNSSYATFTSVVGGTNAAGGNSGNVLKYRIMIESGWYNSVSLGNGALYSASNNPNVYAELDGVYGNDYDRVAGNNSNLEVYYCASGSWGSNYYGSSATAVTFDSVVKSGSFGTGKYDHTSGIYIGGRYGGVHNSARRIKVEGGWIYNLIGGPLTATNRNNYNDTYAYMTGGEADIIITGAGTTATYGHRLLQITGGRVNYSAFGGSNAYAGSGTDGTVNGSGYVYVGGNAEIGNPTFVNNNSVLFGSEAGSVFGIGNGRDGYSSIGSSDNSYVIIDQEALVRRSVYGGGNFGATGVSSASSQTESIINILSGTINGDVYGGGNNNGSGSTSKESTVYINVYDGLIRGSVYGGSNQKGVNYGSTNLNIKGGTIEGDVYGGGKGGYTNTNNSGTFISKNVDVIIGDTNYSGTPLIVGNVYGGSAYGTVNGTVNNNNLSSFNTTVTLNKGTVQGAVFGGGKGSSSFNPYVLGAVTVNVTGGSAVDVYGASDLAGQVNGTINLTISGGTVTNGYGGGNLVAVSTANVYLNGGTVGTLFGGGNLAAITNSKVYLNGGTATDVYGGCNRANATNTEVRLQGSAVTNLFGGSNELGTVNNVAIYTTSGSANTIYGGNNLGGTAYTTTLSLSGGDIVNVYGGGNIAPTRTTWVNLNSGSLTNVYGGGKSANITIGSNITLQGSTVTGNLFGGSNESGTVEVSNLSVTSGSANKLYGGNNEGGITKVTNVNINGGTITTVYGGGKLADTNSTNVDLNSSTVTDVYGGGENADVTVLAKVNLKGTTVTGTIFGGSNVLGNVLATELNLTSGNASNIYGGNNLGGNVGTTTIVLNGAGVNTALYGGGNQAPTTTTNITVSSTANKIPSIFGGGNAASVTTTSQTISGGSFGNLYGGSNAAGTVNTSNINISSGNFDKVYGSNNQGGITNNTRLNITGGTIGNLYGGGDFGDTGNSELTLNNANITGDVFGGGNQAPLDTSTVLTIINSNIDGTIYGGGNFGTVGEDTLINVTSTNVGENIYAGGNGATAIVYGSTLLNVDGSTEVGSHIFGGGNAAATGVEGVNTSTSIVNIAGAKVGGNVYGGANTSVLYGNVIVNIGKNAVSDPTLIMDDIEITGTVFGGGEANASGSEEYDFSFISVTVGINITIDAINHDVFTIDGSIFGSGNASSTTGYSYIDIKNYGSGEDYKKNISIQRANRVNLYNSAIELSGATDRTNEYSSTLFSLSRVDEIKLIDSSVLYLQTGANLLKKFKSIALVGGVETKGVVTIDEEDGSVTRNVTNQVYMYEGKNLNIATNENVTSYGEVYGMTFFGMYTHDRFGNVYTALYNPAYDNDDHVASSEIYYFNNGSYVLGLHHINHNYKEDGFFTNYENEELAEHIIVDYIIPTPEDSNYYMWVIGEQIASYEVDLTASKFSTLGTYELALINSSRANTTFSIVGFNYNNLNSSISLVDDNLIPRVASSGEIADTTMSLVMKTSNSGWLTRGKTAFLTDETYYSGTIDYKTENATNVPSLLFYLYHSKNLQTEGQMGTVTISLIAVTPIDDLSNEVERININVNLTRALYGANEYEATMTPGKEYKMFAPSLVNITSKSSFSSYYSLFVEAEESIYKTGYHRVLTSEYNFPANTKITMIDFYHQNPDYYYYIVTAQDEIDGAAEYALHGEVSYKISNFIKMGSSSVGNHYDDATRNTTYYNSTSGYAEEEFIFIVDLNESGINTDILGKKLLLELRNDENQTLISVIGIQQEGMTFNLYNDKDAIIELDASLSKTSIYIGDIVNLSVNTNFIQDRVGSNSILDTNYFDYRMGIKLSIYDSNGNVVNATSLMGLTYSLNGQVYYPRVDGTVRINVSERVANVYSNILINTTNSNLASGEYVLKVESFGSADGIYYGLISSDEQTIDFTINNSIYGLKVTIDEAQLIVDKNTGNTQNDNNIMLFNVEYSSGLLNPNLRIALYRRDYSVVYTNDYDLVDIKDYVTNTYSATSLENIYLLSAAPQASFSHFIYLKEELMSGTYKVVFSLYDNNTYIGDVYKYLIIK